MAKRRQMIERNRRLFDETPVQFFDDAGRHGFRLRHRAIDVVGKPGSDQFLSAYLYAKASDENAPYWLGELRRIASDRKEWSDLLDEIVDEGGLSRQRAINLASMVKRVDPAVRRLAPSPSHAETVAALPPDEQIAFLEKANEEEWTVPQLREEIRASKRRKVLHGRAVLRGKFRVIFCDCPWQYRESAAWADGSHGKAERHYEGMSIQELCDLPVASHVTDDAVMAFCVPEPLVYNNPGPREVLEAWGFEHRTGFVWDKVLGNPSSYALHIRHEHVFLCIRGSCLPELPTPQQDSVWTQRRSNVHSEKPIEFLKWLEQHWPTGPHLYLFASEPPPAPWVGFGNDARLWADEAESAMQEA